VVIQKLFEPVTDVYSIRDFDLQWMKQDCLRQQAHRRIQHRLNI